MVAIMMPIKCPKCNKMVDHLKLWRQLDNKYFHICEKCFDSPFGEDDILRIAFYYGYQKANEDVKKFLTGE